MDIIYFLIGKSLNKIKLRVVIYQLLACKNKIFSLKIANFIKLVLLGYLEVTFGKGNFFKLKYTHKARNS
ncbi:hypothetical protein CKF54_05085 [Psittacicella hinzii]|uniref:Uncharacterized protein n=1 Tax=Psittacicella hinzii TaxID=2028575 RepID=A0A3A1Y464_9GAMM|nr:hypothetical protein CKF54_05085 [Psittacicella hinzii]